MFIDKNLSTEVSQKQIAHYHMYRQDAAKLALGVVPFAFLGGWAALGTPFWLGNDTWVPSSFAQTAEQKAAWREAQDLYRYKYVPAMLTDLRWFTEFHARVPDHYAHCWDALWEKNDVPRNEGALMGTTLEKMYHRFQPFHMIRRKQARAICRAMGIPSSPGFNKINLQSRIRDYWEVAWNEDYMVVTQKLHETMSDEELYDYAWRRYLAPYDKKLTREQVMHRVNDYHAFLGKKFAEEAKAPSIFMTIAYTMSNYNEVSYLDMDIAELEKNDFEHLSSWGKDAFMQRLEFENGPLRDQVEAHSVKQLAERAKKLAA